MRYKTYDIPYKDRFKSIMVKKELKEVLEKTMRAKHLRSLTELFNHWLEKETEV